MMNFSDDGKMFLIGLEGICLSPYLDSVGVKTIAIGATVSEIPDIADMPWGHVITMKEAFELLDRSLAKYVAAVNKALAVVVSQNQFDALVSVCYNIGTGGLKSSTFIKRINAGMSNESIISALLMWRKPPEILGRRKKEANLFVTGEYGDGKALVFPANAKTHKPVYKQGKEVDIKELLNV